MNNLIPRLTADGSYTFFSTTFNETFHSKFGARQEAESKFVRPTHLAQKALQPRLVLLDVCYGLGYNTAVALETIWAVNPDCQVQFLGLELDATAAIAAVDQGLFVQYSPQVQQVVEGLARQAEAEIKGFRGSLLLGDARQTIHQVHLQGWQADAIFLDPFSPPRCPQLWTVEFLHQLSCALNPQGRLATYSCAAAVRAALLANHLQIGSTPPVGRRAPGTIASFNPIDLPSLSQQEQEHLQTRAAVPYRDPDLDRTPALILQQRQLEQQYSGLETTSQWKKRWLLRGSPGRGQ